MINSTETFKGTWPFTPHFYNGNGFAQHFIDEGPRNAEPIICLHGEPTWGYIYRKFIPQLSEKYRVIVQMSELVFLVNYSNRIFLVKRMTECDI